MASRQQILTNSRTKGGNPPQSIYNPSRRGTYEGAFAYAPAGLKGDKDIQKREAVGKFLESIVKDLGPVVSKNIEESNKEEIEAGRAHFYRATPEQR